jgi:hypothetical protein
VDVDEPLVPLCMAVRDGVESSQRFDDLFGRPQERARGVGLEVDAEAPDLVTVRLEVGGEEEQRPPREREVEIADE